MTTTTKLCLHAGAAAATLADLEAVTTPAPTDSWQPIPHRTLIDLVGRNIGELGLSIVRQEHALWRDGARYFGILELQNGEQPDDYSLIAGIRNSHDKSFPAGLVVGSRVFVCDNLAFSGEIKIARKHTRYIMRDLPAMVNRAVGRLTEHRERQAVRIDAYKRTPLENTQVHDLAIRALDARVVPVTKLPKVLEQWRRPSHEAFQPRTAWSLFNAFTEVLKDSNALERPRRTQALHGLMDQVAGVLHRN